MKVSLTLPQKGLILVIIPVLIGLIFILLLSFMERQAEYEAQRETHARDISSRAQYLNYLADGLPKAALRYWRGQDESDRAFADETTGRFNKTLSELAAVAKDNTYEIRIISHLQLLLDRVSADFNTMKKLKTQSPASNEANQKQMFESLELRIWKASDEVSTQIQDLILLESRFVSTSHSDAASRREELKRVMFIGVSVNVLAAVLLAAFFTVSITNRLKVVTENTFRLAAQKSLYPPLPGQDEIAYLDRVFHDMADAIAEAARKERAVVQNALDVICSVDGDGRLLRMNPASQQLWGYPPEEMVGKAFSSFVPDDDVAILTKTLADARTEPVKPFEMRIIRLDRSHAQCLCSAQWSAMDESLFFVIHDFTERKMLDQLKHEFVAMVTHDLRTPLTSILGSLRLLSSGVYGAIPDNIGAPINVAERNADRLLKLVNELLEVEKLGAGGVDLALSDVLISRVIERSIESIRAFADHREVALVGCSTAAHAWADEDRLVQVVVNLLSNAVKFAPQRSTVNIEVEHNNEWVTVRVVDSGRGIPSDFQKIVFERFKQVERADGAGKGGTGLGLPICKMLVEAHGGTIGMQSKEFEGSTFWFRIPVAEKTVVASQSIGADVITNIDVPG